ncbi:hypothetical protein DH96_00280 [Candidatus Phytoplasma oryzae]|uniref:Uncharacterized protein n=1 Tax=Candidatus Phytoplasma oryzae TaxID=203274 RepID=A0A328IMC5_9MOLU|nr:hypothetical protein DH96_00280 [Candidatus Phytoplasma oryzae]
MYPLNLFFYKQIFFKERKKKILQKFCEKNKYCFITYKIEKNNYNSTIKNIKQELYTKSLFFNKKVIFIENISFLFTSNKYKNNIDISFLFNYFQNTRSDIFIYLIEEKDIFPVNIKKIIFQNFIIQTKISINKTELISYIYKIFQKDNFIIKSKIIYKIIEKTYGDLMLLHQEIEKIKIYYYNKDNKIIDDENIIDELIYSEDRKIFLLINSMLQKNKIIENFLLFKNLANDKKNIFIIINQILKKLKNFIIIKKIKKEKKREKIISLLKCSHNELDFLIQEAKNLDIEKINNLFIFFSELLFQIKKENLLSRIKLEMFFIKEIFGKNIL